MGLGASERPKAVRWSKAQDILRTWLITIPAAGVVGAVAALGVRLIFAIT
jgi:PiT family inorganic phosphate transporter